MDPFEVRIVMYEIANQDSRRTKTEACNANYTDIEKSTLVARSNQMVERRCDALQSLPNSAAVCTCGSRASDLEPQRYTTAQTLLLRLSWARLRRREERGTADIDLDEMN
jgi:hypothetical protein